MSDDDKGNIIQLPGADSSKKSKDTTSKKDDKAWDDQKPITITKDSVTRLVKSLSTIHMATTYKAKTLQKCKDNIYSANFPCKLNCTCYVNLCAAMGLESFLGGPSQEEAIFLIDAEHDLISNIYKDLIDEDAVEEEE